MSSVCFGLSLVSVPLPSKTWHKRFSFFCSSFLLLFVVFCFVLCVFHLFFGFSYFVVDLDKSRRRRRRSRAMVTSACCGWCKRVCVDYTGWSGGAVRQGGSEA